MPKNPWSKPAGAPRGDVSNVIVFVHNVICLVRYMIFCQHVILPVRDVIFLSVSFRDLTFLVRKVIFEMGRETNAG